MFYGVGLLHQISGVSSFAVINNFDDATKWDELSPDSRYYVFDAEVAGVHWLADNVDPERFLDIIADENGRLNMASHGLIPYDTSAENLFLGNSSVAYLNLSGKYFYLRYENLKYQKAYAGVYINITDTVVGLQRQNKLYDNEISQIFQVAG